MGYRSVFILICIAAIIVTVVVAVQLRAQASRPAPIPTAATAPPLLSLTYGDAAAPRTAYVWPHGTIIATSTPTARTVPALHGLMYDTIGPNARIPLAYTALLASLAAVREQAPAVYAEITDVVIINKSQNTYELLLYTTITSLPIVAEMPVSVRNLETAIITTAYLGAIADTTGVTHISIRGPRPVIRYDEL